MKIHKLEKKVARWAYEKHKKDKKGDLLHEYVYEECKGHGCGNKATPGKFVCLDCDQAGNLNIEGDPKGLDEYLWRKTTWIYFILCDNKYIKIGKSRSIKDRFYQHQISNPYDLQLLLAIMTSEYVEKALHEMFKSENVRGEWFHAHGEVKEMIRGLVAGEKPDCIEKIVSVMLSLDEGDICEP